MKKYILYAGVNGAGKSTLYHTTHYNSDILRVNTDEILKEFGAWNNQHALFQAGKKAVKLIEQYFEEGVERRYTESLENLKLVMELCDLVAIYDNTKELRRFAIYKGNRLVRISKNIPQWFDLNNNL